LVRWFVGCWFVSFGSLVSVGSFGSLWFVSSLPLVRRYIRSFCSSSFSVTFVGSLAVRWVVRLLIVHLVRSVVGSFTWFVRSACSSLFRWRSR
jgi:hypothetical protein